MLWVTIMRIKIKEPVPFMTADGYRFLQVDEVYSATKWLNEGVQVKVKIGSDLTRVVQLTKEKFEVIRKCKFNIGDKVISFTNIQIGNYLLKENEITEITDIMYSETFKRFFIKTEKLNSYVQIGLFTKSEELIDIIKKNAAEAENMPKFKKHGFEQRLKHAKNVSKKRK